jgi:predicted ATP-grasp superfamily ATP-dependent carboligase
MQVLIFEWLTGGGLWIDQGFPNPEEPIQVQGRKMLEAIIEDFLDGGLNVVAPIDARIEISENQIGLNHVSIRSAKELPLTLNKLANEADFVLVIAPESGHCLSECLTWIRASWDKLVSPDFAFVEIAQSKRKTIQFLNSNGFQATPRILDHHCDDSSSAVLKPAMGAGSEQIEFIPDLSLWQPGNFAPNDFQLEEFIAGTSVSVSVIGQRKGNIFLPPTEQLFDRKPFGEYVGTGYPIDDSIAQRATKIARQAVALLPATRGYFGIDIVVAEDPLKDCLIEINPRLTMSYLKLREICSDNLAMKMLPNNWVD